jgi:L-serine/L-threonine ammonia-lyase
MAITVETHRATTSKVTASGQPLTVPYPRLHTITPLVYSEGLSASSGHNIWLKLETEQLSGSFKPRGIGRSCWAAVQRLGPAAHLVAASGGNAGIAAALSARTLGVKCTVFVHDKTEQLVMDKMRSYGANVRVMDGGWERVDAGARELARTDPLAQYIHPKATMSSGDTQASSMRSTTNCPRYPDSEAWRTPFRDRMLSAAPSAEGV